MKKLSAILGILILCCVVNAANQKVISNTDELKQAIIKKYDFLGDKNKGAIVIQNNSGLLACYISLNPHAISDIKTNFKLITYRLLPLIQKSKLQFNTLVIVFYEYGVDKMGRTVPVEKIALKFGNKDHIDKINFNNIPWEKIYITAEKQIFTDNKYK